MPSKQRIEASTTVISNECIYTWTIKNYRLIKSKVGEPIASPKFGVGSDNKQYFTLQLYPAGSSEKYTDISLFLKPITDSTKKPNKLVCRWTLSAINNKKVVRKSTLHHDFATTEFHGRGLSFYELKNIEELISSENTVTIQCELEVFKKYESSLDVDIINNKDQMNNKVNLDSLLLSEEFSDVKLITSDDNDIPAHKNILAVASPVFRAMFTHDMLENKGNSVEITDTPYNILVEMLRFIYTGDIVSTKTDIVLEILAVADKYQVDNLKIMCEKILSANLSTKNAIEILSAAQKYNAMDLESNVHNFLKLNSKSIIDPEKIKKMKKPVLIKLLQSFSKE
ncbi:speckle-type POZ protein B-like [Trichogramma pretiosum]|uniref:speckle-type POZ protein B-like n=1 Tax=Trichogramma pretiosum TaxID=7493 RepID=UPI0006C9419D|nr:speckle-type POZ protein B-like [Trichogramma pretiosum]